ncbi:MAG: 50S ribosomal protein L4 [Candidatus Paceibacterota bacterium]|jgi:large subunit ribosomal protein L4
MAQISVYNLEGKEKETIEVPVSLIQTPWNADLVHQALVTQQANSRSVIAHTKGRGEVRGGGRKPWKQKGTGRARHGSIRSPIWKGGGVTHGPLKEKVYARAINKKMAQKAVFSVLSKKYLDKELFVVDGFSDVVATTKDLRRALGNFMIGRESIAVIFSKEHAALQRGVRNMPRTRTIAPHALNVVDLLTPKKIILEKDAIKEILAHYAHVRVVA